MKIPTIYELKPRFQNLLRPLTRVLHRSGITANVVTISAILGSLGYGIWMFLSPADRLPFMLLPLVLLVRMALNAIDGMLARDYHQQSRLGAILNEVGDVISDTALYLPFALLPGAHADAVIGVVLLSILTEFVGVLAQVVGAGRRYDGPMGKSDRAVVFSILGLLVGLGLPVLSYFYIAFLVIALLLVWTVINRCRQALRVS